VSQKKKGSLERFRGMKRGERGMLQGINFGLAGGDPLEAGSEVQGKNAGPETRTKTGLRGSQRKGVPANAVRSVWGFFTSFARNSL